MMKNKNILGSFMCGMEYPIPPLFPVHIGRTVMTEVRAREQRRKNMRSRIKKQRRREPAPQEISYCFSRA
jgi:hypothetical protein